VTLTLAAIGYRYAGSGEPALLDVDLELRGGEVIGLVGASESGKTTLCLVASGLAPRAIGGLLRGRIAIDGEDVDSWPMHRLSQHVGIGFQSPATQLSQVTATVFEEVAFGPVNFALPRDEVAARTWDALSTVGITDLAERDPRRLSGGQQQLLAIAGLLALGPAHLVLDEPTAQLDPEGTRLVTDALARLAEGGTAILVAEQKTDVLAALASRIAVLDHGRLVMAGPSDEVLGDRRLTELGVTPPAVVRLRQAAAAAGIGAGLLAEALIDA
jgi:energy-coupling factor transporter ATP-binding protein EcfA2